MSHWIWGSERVESPSPRSEGKESHDRLSSKIRIATKYPKITERYFNQRGIPVEIIKLYGSIELAPVVGLADRIVDLVETGNTLKAHDLVEIEVHRPIDGPFHRQQGQSQVETPGHCGVTENLRLACASPQRAVPSRVGAASTVGRPEREADAHMKIVPPADRAFFPP